MEQNNKQHNISLIVGSKIDIQYVGDNDEKVDKSWHIATIIDENSDNQIKIRYDSEIDSDEDEFIDKHSDRIDLLHKHTKRLSLNSLTERHKIRYEMSIADWKPIMKPPAINSIYSNEKVSKYLYYYSTSYQKDQSHSLLYYPNLMMHLSHRI